MPDSIYKSVYRMALGYGDPLVAIQAVYYQLAKEPTSLALRDTLATLYFNTRLYFAGVQVAKEVLTKEPNNTKMLELVALSYQAQNLSKESLEAYERLYPLTKNVFHLYQIATLQYSLQRYGECNLTVGALLTDAESEKQKVSITAGQKTQQVMIKAAAVNLKGVVLMEQKEYASAQQQFEEALKLQADFELAKNNLDAAKKQLAPKGK